MDILEISLALNMIYEVVLFMGFTIVAAVFFLVCALLVSGAWLDITSIEGRSSYFYEADG
jgi:hypothetical protein